MNEHGDHGNAANDWKEDIVVAGKEAVERIKDLIREGNVRSLVIKKPNGEVIKEFTLTQGVAIGAALTMVVPVLAVVGAAAALIGNVKIEVTRHDGPSAN